MPQVAAWIDALRDAFGREHIDDCIRRGLQDGTFGATENGHRIGSHAMPQPGGDATATRSER